MSDCNHESIKCMRCHRYVGITEQIIPTSVAVKRIQELELEILLLKVDLEMYTITQIPESNVGIKGNQHETS